MPFRARLNPVSLARRQAAALRLSRPRALLAVSSAAGPGPSTTAAFLARAYASSTAPRSSLLSDFFGKSQSTSKSPKIAKSDLYVNSVMAALRSTQTEDLAETYDDLLRQVAADPRTRRLNPDEALLIMEALAERSGPRVLPFIRKLYSDLEPVHGFRADDRHLRAILVGLASQGEVQAALELVQSIEVTSEAWYALVKAAVTRGPEQVDAVLAAIKSFGMSDEKLYAPLLDPFSKAKEGVTEGDVEAVLERIKAEGVTPGPWCESRCVAAYIALGDATKAAAIAAKWSPNRFDDVELRRELWTATVNADIARGDVAGVETALRTMECTPPVRAFPYLLAERLGDGLPDANAVIAAADQIAHTTGHDLSSDAWAIVIVDLRRNGMPADGLLQIYHGARSRTITGSALAKVLVTILCKQSPPRIPEAMEVYQDLLVAADSDPLDASIQPSKSLYTRLITACSEADPPAASEAIALASDMKQRLNREFWFSGNSLTTYVNRLMRGAADHPDAFDVYSTLHSVTRSPLPEQSYDAIITTFIALSFPGSVVAPPDYVINMMQDMRRAGYSPGTRILTKLLQSYALLCRSARQRASAGPSAAADVEFQRAALLSATRDIASLVNLDSGVGVDVPLLTSLMDAQGSAGAYAEALDTWDEIVRRRPLEAETSNATAQQFSASINVALDTCGHADLYTRASKIWLWANRHKLVRNRRNWAAWVECLARTGRLEAALDALAQAEAAGHTVNAEMVAIVPKFGWRAPDKGARIVKLVKERYPQLWPRVAEMSNRPV